MCEVLDTPLDLTASQRLMLLALAERARDDTREVLPGRGESVRAMLLRRTGLTESGLSNTMRGVARLVGDVRVPIATGDDGRAVYAWRGQQTTRFRLPILPLLESDEEDKERPHENEAFGGKGSREWSQGPTTVGPSERKSPQESEALSLSPSEIPQPRATIDPRHSEAAASLLVRFGTALDEDTALRAVAAIDAKKSPGNLVSYITPFGLPDILRYAGQPAGRPTVSRAAPRPEELCKVCGRTEVACQRAAKASGDDHVFTPLQRGTGARAGVEERAS